MQGKKASGPTLKQQTMIDVAVALHQSGQLDVAETHYRKLLKLLPSNTTLLSNLGAISYQKGHLEAALKIIGRSLQTNPKQAYALNNLASTLKDLKRLEEALEYYDRAIALEPDFALAYSNRGNALQELKRLDEAVYSYERAIALKPDYAEAYCNLGAALKELQRFKEAIEHYDYAIALRPDYAEAYYNRGVTLKDLMQLDQALASFEHAITLKPDYAQCHHNRGITLQELKRLNEAQASYEHALTLKPDIDFILGSLLHTKMHLCIWNNLPQSLDELTHKINNNEKVVLPFPILALIDDPDIQRKTAEIYVNNACQQNYVLPQIIRYPKHTKIRIGYFSADFRNHPMTHLTAELYETHDRNQFEIYAFSFGPDTKDIMNLRIKAGVDHFIDVRTLSDKEVAMLSRSIEIDIAVDLSGYTGGCRTEIFALQAAPIQVSYLGYPGTMAADYMHYLIADRTVITDHQQQYYSEKIVYLPNSYLVNISKIKVSERVLTRQEHGLPDTSFIFCCFNNSFKVTPTTFAGWMRILKAVEDSVLWLFEDNSTTIENLRKEAVKLDINEDRLIFAKHMPVEEHLNRLQLANLFLDTLPYNAHTTTSDALRMGLPVLTCIGHSFASRVAASLLNAVNLPELITNTPEEYEALAIDLASHQEKLKLIKAKLAANLATTPLYNTPLFTKHLESAYLTMHDRYQNGLAPEHIYVTQK